MTPLSKLSPAITHHCLIFVSLHADLIKVFSMWVLIVNVIVNTNFERTETRHETFPKSKELSTSMIFV